MTEQKKRTSIDVQTDFNNLAFRAGHLQKDIYSKERELKLFNETLDSLQVEYNTLKQQEAELEKALEAAKAKDNVTSIGEGKKE